MEPEQSAQLEHILRYMSVGVAILACPDMRLRYANPFILSLLDQPISADEVIGRPLSEIIPDELLKVAMPFLQQICATGKRKQWADIPYEGFLAARGRTYWHVTVECPPKQELTTSS